VPVGGGEVWQVAQFVTIDVSSLFQGLATMDVPTQASDACTATFFCKLAPFAIAAGWKGVKFAKNMANRVTLGTFEHSRSIHTDGSESMYDVVSHMKRACVSDTACCSMTFWCR
jgi:hypothetical protein